MVPGFVKAAMAQDYVDRRDELAEIWTDFHGNDLLDARLGEIASPTWVLWGSEDKLVDPSAAPVWAEGIPQARLTVYEGIGHMPMIETPGRSASDYRAFLDAVSEENNR